MSGQKSTNTEFAQLVARARQQARMTQGELARIASVSPKTIVRLENEGIARSDAVVRLAAVLSQPVEVWLKYSGQKLSEKRVQEILDQQRVEGGGGQFPRLDPADYFRRMLDHLERHKTAIMVSVITSRVPVNRPDLVGIWGDLLNRGLTWAVVCPFPVASEEFALHLPRLNGYYSRSLGWARDLSARMEQLFGKEKGHVEVFTLKAGNQATLVYPPLRVADMRPALIKYSQVKSEQGKIVVPARYACGAYISFTDGRADRWLDIYDGASEMNERTEDAFGIWADYLAEIADKWTPTAEGPKFDTDSLRFWKRMPK
jgi:DNA-binding XRE family transcriptional regulator